MNIRRNKMTDEYFKEKAKDLYDTIESIRNKKLLVSLEEQLIHTIYLTLKETARDQKYDDCMKVMK
jgi:hypothetical protein